MYRYFAYGSALSKRHIGEWAAENGVDARLLARGAPEAYPGEVEVRAAGEARRGRARERKASRVSDRGRSRARTAGELDRSPAPAERGYATAASGSGRPEGRAEAVAVTAASTRWRADPESRPVASRWCGSQGARRPSPPTR